MKNVFKQICFIALVAVMGLSFAAPVQAGGIVDRVFNSGAKSLAKQVADTSKKAAALQEKAADIEEKALALSDRDRRAYQAELERLGFQPPPGLFNDGQALLTGAPPAPEGPGGILGLIGGLFGGGGSRSGSSSGNRSGGAEPTEAEIQAALEAAQQILGGATAPPATTPTPAPAPASTPTPATTPASTPTPATTPASGLTWTDVSERGFGCYDIRAIAYGNNRFVAGGWGSKDDPAKMGYFEDGSATWTAVDVRGIFGTFDTTTIYGIAYGGGRFVAVGGAFGTMAYSDDGVSWTRVAGDNGLTETWAIAYGMNAEGNGRFVAGDTGGAMAYSDDGITWSGVSYSAFRNTSNTTISAIAYGNGTWVAVGGGRALNDDFKVVYDGKLAYSSDGESWTVVDVSSIFSNGINAITWGNGRFVVGGHDGKMAYSADGVRWTAVSNSTFTLDINGIAYGMNAQGNGRFVAVGGTGKIAYADW